MKFLWKKRNDFEKMVFRKTAFSFSLFIIYLLSCYFIYNWIITSPKEMGAVKPFRKVMELNSAIFSRSFDKPSLTREYDRKDAVRNVRFNGNLGLKSEMDTETWVLKVVPPSGFSPIKPDTLLVTLEELKKLPHTEVVFNFKCIEGWSQITWWGGVRFIDFLKYYKLGTRSGNFPDAELHEEDFFRFTGLETPDKKYYVGIDMASMVHPQTILCYELNGNPLPMREGAPLRLIIPVKYGIKHIKRIGTIFFSDAKPRDYWTERGYDYYAGF